MKTLRLNNINRHADSYIDALSQQYDAEGLEVLAKREGWWPKLGVDFPEELRLGYVVLYKLHLLGAIYTYFVHECWRQLR